MPTTLFPHPQVRAGQDTLMRAVYDAIEAGGQLVAHAPTGLGKTAAALAPAIERAIEKGKTVVFLTSRLTQHALALETVRRIGTRHTIPLAAVDLVGKRHLCLQEGMATLSGREFAEHCKALRESKGCPFYERLRTNEELSAATRSALIQLGKQPGATPVQVRSTCAEPEHGVCPYEVTMLLAKDARVIVTDYAYLFNERIREAFLRRLNRDLSDLIVIVDEGHNVPDRVKELATQRITTATIARAVREMEKSGLDGRAHHVRQIGDLLTALSRETRDERIITRAEFLDGVLRISPLEPLIADLESTAELVRNEGHPSSAGALAAFLFEWTGEDDGYVRILSVGRDEHGKGSFAAQSSLENEKDLSAPEDIHPLLRSASPTATRKRGETDRWPKVELRYRCLDPSIITSPVLRGAHAAIVMSGTLTPVDMYTRLLGIPEAATLELPSPFPRHNRLNVIIPRTTTRFTTRSPQMYREIATQCSRIINAVPGNSAVFFPSYAILSQLRPFIEATSERTVFIEDASFTREDREDLLRRFRQYKASGAALLGVMGGSFSEGIDLPGDELRAVIVVGLPLARPDLETKATIDHYQRVFARGWDYAYTYPAFNKTLQTAGRCIRTEHDRGVIAFLDERYAWPSYSACFPAQWEMRTAVDAVPLIKQFFSTPPEDEIAMDERQ